MTVIANILQKFRQLLISPVIRKVAHSTGAVKNIIEMLSNKIQFELHREPERDLEPFKLFAINLQGHWRLSLG